MKVNNISGKLWGPDPQFARWAYLGMVRPKLSYAAIVWAHEINHTSTLNKLQRLNRLGLNVICTLPKSTPTRAIEIALDVQPLHLHLTQVALSAMYRLQFPIDWNGVGKRKTYSTSHLRHWYNLVEKYQLHEIKTPHRLL